MKKVTIFFDTEGFWEAPYRGAFDEEKNVALILEILDKYSAKAVFNTCGIIGEMYPNMIKLLAKEGHEISSHGYRHENFLQLTEQEMHQALEKTEKITEKLTKQKIIGLRAPWLSYNEKLYTVIKERGYKWASNYSLPFPEVFSNPAAIKGHAFYRKLAKLTLSFRHSFYKPEPFIRNGILEIPLTTPLESDILGIMNYWQNSPKEWLDYAYNALVSRYSKCPNYCNLNFHPWLIAGANRPELLDKILSYITKHDAEFVLARDLLPK